MKSLVLKSDKQNPEEAFFEISNGIEKAALLIYFSSDRLFPEITKKIKEKYPELKSIGCSTHSTYSGGKIQEEGSLAIWITEGVECSGDYIPEISTFPLKSVQKIKNAAESLSSFKNTICLEFTTAFSYSEEQVLTALDTVTSEKNIPVVGGTCGVKDLKAEEEEISYVAINGEVHEKAAVFMFIHSLSGKISIIKENIYVPSKHQFTATQVDIKNRMIKELNRKPAADTLCSTLNLSKDELTKYLQDHPIGRLTGNEVYISAFEKINYDRSISFSSRIYNNTKVQILDLGNFNEITEETIIKIKKETENPSLVLMIHCDARLWLYKRENLIESFSETWKNAFPQAAGFTTHGEQLGKIHFNLTMLAVAFE